MQIVPCANQTAEGKVTRGYYRGQTVYELSGPCEQNRRWGHPESQASEAMKQEAHSMTSDTH